MNLRIRMKSAMLLLIMLCVLCVNSVLAREKGGMAAGNAGDTDIKICYVAEEFAETQRE